MPSEPTPPSGWASHEPRTLLEEVDHQRARADAAEAALAECCEWRDKWKLAVDEMTPALAKARFDAQALAEALHSGPDGLVRGRKGLVELALEASYDEATEFVGDPEDGITMTDLRKLGDLVSDYLVAQGARQAEYERALRAEDGEKALAEAIARFLTMDTRATHETRAILHAALVAHKEATE